MINRLLTHREDSGNLSHSEVVLVDLDYELPEITPPGTLAVTRIKEPLLGPSFTHPSTAFEVIKMHFVGNAISRSPSQQVYEAMYDLAQTARELSLPHVPTVIRLPAQVIATGRDFMEKLWQVFKVTELVQADGSSTEMLESLATLNSVPIQRFTQGVVENKLSAMEDYEVRLQSYFHRSGPTTGLPAWHDLPLMTIPSARKVFSFATSQDTFAAVLLLDALVDPGDTHDAVLGSIGAVVAVAKGHFEQELRPHVRTQRGSLPRLLWSDAFNLYAAHSECLGMVYLAEIDTENLEVLVYTPVSETKLAVGSDRILLLVHPGRRQHRWLHSGWIASEVEGAEP